jgi:4-amino-4-deoxy-L-arabinose transferase-like glycosyltransferase
MRNNLRTAPFGESVVGANSDLGWIRNNVHLILFWSVAVLLLFWGIGAKELWGPEDRWAEIVREMRLTGDYFHPTINGTPYFDKPLLSYWLIALVSTITGRLDEMVLRLPSAIAALVALGATMNLGKRLFNRDSALTACWILLGTYGFVFWGRTGEADMENLAAIVLAVAWYWARRDKPGFVSYLVFYLICFIGAHTKGMATIAVPIIVVLPDMLREKRWRSYLSISNFMALIIGLGVYLAPFLYADFTRQGYRASGLWFAFRENITRYFKPFDHKEPFYVYFYYLPKLFFPWTVLLVGAIWTCKDNFKKLDWPTKWLAISAVLIFLFFTISGSRRSYYILPILPFCALLVSQYTIIEPKEHSKRIMLGIQTGVLVAIFAAEVISPAIWPLMRRTVGFAPPVDFMIVTAILGVLAFAYFVIDVFRPARSASLIPAPEGLTRIIVISIIIMGGFFVSQEKSLDKLRSLKAFSIDVKESAESLGDDNIAFYKDFPPKMLFHLETSQPVRVFQDAQELQDFLDSKSEPWILIAHSEYRDEMAPVLLSEMLDEPDMREQVFPWEKEKKKYAAWIINAQEQGKRLTAK